MLCESCFFEELPCWYKKQTFTCFTAVACISSGLIFFEKKIKELWGFFFQINKIES